MKAALTVDSIASNLDQLAAEELVGTINKISFLDLFYQQAMITLQEMAVF